ncbi:nucleotide exchange factor GrpE [candidate division KSB1 bacterium]|nr:nucleotide exchange factor GrpE [candidate division KSB1 bacterium]
MTANRAEKEIDIEIKDEDDVSDELKMQDNDQKEQPSVAEREEEEKSAPQVENFDYLEKYLRLQAEFLNYKRRNEQRMQEWRLYAAKDIVSQILPVIDDFDILFSHSVENSTAICIDGVKMIYNKLLSSLKELGLEPIAAVGQKFDPTIHEAVMAEESEEVEQDHVLRVWQQGFMFKETLLRPAKVITAKQKQNGARDGEQ